MLQDQQDHREQLVLQDIKELLVLLPTADLRVLQVLVQQVLLAHRAQLVRVLQDQLEPLEPLVHKDLLVLQEQVLQVLVQQDLRVLRAQLVQSAPQGYRVLQDLQDLQVMTEPRAVQDLREQQVLVLLVYRELQEPQAH